MSDFLCPSLPNRPCQTVVVVKSGQDDLSQTLYWQKWPKSVFEIVVMVERKKRPWSNLTNGNANVTIGMSQSCRCCDTIKAEKVAAANGGQRLLVHGMFTNTYPAFCRRNVRCKVKGGLEQQRGTAERNSREQDSTEVPDFAFCSFCPIGILLGSAFPKPCYTQPDGCGNLAQRQSFCKLYRRARL